jgi:hypothetical protein
VSTGVIFGVEIGKAAGLQANLSPQFSTEVSVIGVAPLCLHGVLKEDFEKCVSVKVCVLLGKGLFVYFMISSGFLGLFWGGAPPPPPTTKRNKSQPPKSTVIFFGFLFLVLVFWVFYPPPPPAEKN